MDLVEVVERYGHGRKWVWSAGPEYVLDEDDQPRADLEPVDVVRQNAASSISAPGLSVR